MSGQPRFLCIAVSGMLLFQIPGITRAAATGWECRASADGAGWDCTPGQQDVRDAPAPGAAAPLTEPVDPAEEAPPALTGTKDVPVPAPREPGAEEPGLPPGAPALAAPAAPEVSEEEAPVAETAPPAPQPESEDEGPPPEAPALTAPAAPEVSEEGAPLAETAPPAPQRESEYEGPPPETPALAAPAAPEMSEEEASAAPIVREQPSRDEAAESTAEDVRVEETRVADEPEPAAAEEATPVGAATGRSPLLDEGLSWETCGPLSVPRRVGPAAEDTLTRISADSAEFFQEDEVYILTGGIDLTRGRERARADQARFDKNNGRLTAEGNVFFEQPNLRFTGDSAELDLQSHQGWLRNVEYRLIQANARGTADTAFVETPTLSHFENISYTTCRPEYNDWLLFAEHLTLDDETGKGTASNAELRLWDVPVLYTPYFSFPLDDRRQTGFLTPSFGNTETTGIDVSVPYYINIAPDMDATVTPRIMSKRGLMMGAEFRYLRENYSGEIAGEFLPYDQDNSDDVSDHRGQFSFQHRRQLAPRWSTNIDAHWVSDDDYLEDFGDNLSVSSTRNVNQLATVNYSGDAIDFQGLIQHFNTIDNDIAAEDQAYNRLPSLLFRLNKPDQFFGTTYHLRTEYTYFDHDHKEHGHRVSLRPGVSLPLRKPYGHLIPKVSLDYTAYGLEGEQPDQSTTQSRTLPTASLDAGLVFEREIDWLGHAAAQTLEPRLFYLYTPKEDQDEHPVFDSTDLDLSFGNLFRENRFTGQDRIGDANQVTLALTSRTVESNTGKEILSAGIGQIFYFRDRKVQLPGVDDRKNSSSVIIGEAAARLTDSLSARAGLTWDPHASGSQKREKASAELHYQTPGQHIFNLAYRFNRGQDSDKDNTRFEDVDASVRWPLTPALRFVGRWNYSLFLEKTVDAFGGIEYGPCCWTLRAIARHFIKDRNGGSNNIYMVQLELRGLGKLGHKVEDFLERGIYGYQQE